MSEREVPTVWPQMPITGNTFVNTSVNTQYLCPDLLSIRYLGAADGWRGRVVRGFFHVLRAVTGV